MTTAFVRINRAGSWCNVEFDQLTPEELEKFANDHPEDGWKWAKFLALWIQKHVSADPQTYLT